MEIGGLGRTALGQVRPHGPLHLLEDFHDDDMTEVIICCTDELEHSDALDQ